MAPPNTNVKVGFLCDLSTTSGHGHIKRSLNLSNAFERSGCECYFYANTEVYSLFKKFIPDRSIRILNDAPTCLDDKLVDLFKNEILEVLVIDSYTHTRELEEKIRDHGALIVSIDDHLLRHDSHLVFNNRAGPILKNIENPYSAIWHIGREFILTKLPPPKDTRQNKIRRIEKILLHAGGSSSYKQIKPLIYETIRIADQYEFSLNILCSNQHAKHYVNSILEEFKAPKSVHIIPYVANLSDELINYDIVAGPAGTTTFECLFAGVLPFSVPLSDDGRDAPETWPYLGHMLHLNYEEAQNNTILKNLWDFCINHFSDLSNILNKHHLNFDGKGPQRIAEITLDQLKLDKMKNYKDLSDNFDENILSSKAAKLEDARLFLNARNQDFVRNNSSDPDHKISWPEHLNWWLERNIYRYGLWQGNKIVAFYWSKLVEDDEGRFVVSGWMPVADVENKFKIAAWVVEHQIKQVKNDFHGELWLISMQKENPVARFLNKRANFKDATPNSVARAAKAFGVSQKHFDFMEMNL
jgi:spore coat polysaccharide biosynthesis predicted glycosyltransferase SpsG